MKEVTQSVRRESNLQDQLLRECEAMAKYAFASGLQVPGKLIQTLESFVIETTDKEVKVKGGTVDATALKTQDSMHGEVRHYLSGESVKQLAAVHGHLAELIAPAKPQTVLLLDNESAKRSFWRFFGPIPLVGHMMIIAIVCLAALIILAMSPQIDGNPERFSLFTNSGFSLLLHDLFLLAAAGIGASLHALFHVNQYIKARTFDPVYGSTYWVRFVLGLLSGSVLAVLIPIGGVLPVEGGLPGSEGDPPLSGTFKGLGKPLMAMLGGFSAAVVYRILNRLLAAVETLVRGDTRDMIAFQEEVSKARYAERTIQTRLKLSAKLTRLQQKFTEASDPEELRQEIAQIQNELLSFGNREEYETQETRSHEKKDSLNKSTVNIES